MERWAISLLIREIQIKPQEFTPIEMAIIKNKNKLENNQHQ